MLTPPWQPEPSLPTRPPTGSARLAPTSGPTARYSAVLYTEKEGFDEQFRAAGLFERLDIVPMSTKGMPVTAERELIVKYSEIGVPVFVLHNFDVAGLSILHAQRATKRQFKFKKTPLVHDLGLRLEDVEELNRDPNYPPIQWERVDFGRIKKDPRIQLAKVGTTEAEQNYLVKGRDKGRWVGRRVELNAVIPGDRFVQWVETKLVRAGVRKVVPDDAMLVARYRQCRRELAMQRALDQIAAQIPPDTSPLPPDFAALVRQRIDGTIKSWDEAVLEIARQEVEGTPTPPKPSRARRKAKR